MATLPTILQDLEAAVLAKLKAAGLSTIPTANIDVGQPENKVTTPWVRCMITGISFVQLTNKKIKAVITFGVALEVQNLKDDHERRKACYPVVMGILLALSGSELGLAITAIVPKRGIDTGATDEELKTGCMRFQLDFETATTITLADADADAPDLLKICVSYFLQPDETTPAAQDEFEAVEEGT